MAAGVVKSITVDGGIVIGMSGSVTQSGDYASGSITFNTFQPSSSGLILGVQVSGVWTTLTLASGLKISGGALYLG